MDVKHRLRRHTILLFVGFTLFISALFTAVSFLIAYSVEDELINNLLIQEIAYLQQPDDSKKTPRFDYFSVHQQISTMPTSVVNELQKRPNAREIFTDDQFHYHIYPFLMDDKAYYLLAEVSSLLTVSRYSGHISRLMLYIGLFAIALAGWAAFKIANYSSQPLVKLTNELTQYANTTEQIKLAASNDDNEIGYLANTIEHSMNALASALCRESEFTHDVSHELRTPMTVLKNMLQLAEHRGWQQGDIAQMQQQLQLMQQLVDVLLILARQQSIPRQQMAILPLVEEALLEQHYLLASSGVQANINLPESLEVNGNSQLIRLLFKILLENAVQHGAQGTVSISQQAAHILIENPHGVDNIKSNGIGLNLADKVARSMGWSIECCPTSSHFTIVICPV
ncbi:HAMP domain-containing sensor histidine kinase [Alteromonadaceae bacterium BrNp21-10]|nr:HAMP domain-containing sensor histidine kinase [Alteromonadaceae bacterium BrNp21-10]